MSFIGTYTLGYRYHRYCLTGRCSSIEVGLLWFVPKTDYETRGDMYCEVEDVHKISQLPDDVSGTVSAVKRRKGHSKRGMKIRTNAIVT